MFISNKVNIKCGIIYLRFAQGVHYMLLMYTLCTLRQSSSIKVCTERFMCSFQGTSASFKKSKIQASAVFSAEFYSNLIVLSSVRYPKSSVHNPP